MKKNKCLNFSLKVLFFSFLVFLSFFYLVKAGFSGYISGLAKILLGPSDNVINFSCTNCSSSLDDEKMKGFAYGSYLGWINLEPSNNYYVKNSYPTLDGFAWGQNAGWINFCPDPSTAEKCVTLKGCSSEGCGLSGKAWAQNWGYIGFPCTGTGDFYGCGVTTDWHPEVSGGGGGGGEAVPIPQVNLVVKILYPESGQVLSIESGEESIETLLKAKVGGFTSEPAVTFYLNNEEVSCSLEISSSDDNEGLIYTCPTSFKEGTYQMKVEAKTNSGTAYDSIAFEVQKSPPEFIEEMLFETPVVAPQILITYPSEEEIVFYPDSEEGQVLSQGSPIKISIRARVVGGSVNKVFFFVNSETDPRCVLTEPSETSSEGNFYICETDFTVDTQTLESIYKITAKAYFDSQETSDSVTFKLRVGIPQVPLLELEQPEEEEEEEGIIFEFVPIEEEIISLGKISPIVSPIQEEIKNIIENIFGSYLASIYEEAGKFFEKQKRSIQGSTIAGIVAGALGPLTAALFLNPLSLGEIFLLPIRLWSALLMLLGIKKRTKIWGVIYDSQTKQPLDPAYVVLIDSSGKEVNSAITDIDGRYGFLVENPGIYYLKSEKTDYQFPSSLLKDKKDDELYTNLYFGEPIEIKETGGVIARNIPMDALKFNWNEFAKNEQKLMHFYSRRDLWISRISNFLFVFGFILAFVAAFFAPYPYNFIICGLYVLILILRKTHILKPRHKGVVIDRRTNLPVPFAIIRIFSAKTNVQLIQRVTDKLGRYLCLVPPGTYYIKVERKNPDGSYTAVYHSNPFESKKGVIDLRIKI